MNVLHVTSDIGETDVLQRELSARGQDLSVECAGTFREAIERLEGATSHYDAVLIELTQNDAEGLSLITQIRKHHLPVGVVAVTSARDDGFSREALGAGADHFVVRGAAFLTSLPTVLAHAVERRTLEGRLRVLLEKAPACLMRVAVDGTILAMNVATLDLVEADGPDQVVDQSWYERIAPESRAACSGFIERAAHGERGSLECDLLGFSGTQRKVVMHAVCAPVDAGGEPSALVGIRGLDKTRGLEARLEEGVEQHRQRLEALQRALDDAKAKNQRLLARHDADRAEWRQQLEEAQGATAGQPGAEPDRLEAGMMATAGPPPPSADRAALERAEARHRQGILDERQLNDALERALAQSNAKCKQLAADLEAERADWQQEVMSALAPEDP